MRDENRTVVGDGAGELEDVLEVGAIYNYRSKHRSESLPSINLVGHSMGGLINMQYAIKHPKNVATLVSLGTPYNGSWYDNWFTNTFVDKTFVKQ